MQPVLGRGIDLRSGREKEIIRKAQSPKSSFPGSHPNRQAGRAKARYAGAGHTSSCPEGGGRSDSPQDPPLTKSQEPDGKISGFPLGVPHFLFPPWTAEQPPSSGTTRHPQPGRVGPARAICHHLLPFGAFLHTREQAACPPTRPRTSSGAPQSRAHLARTALR